MYLANRQTHVFFTNLCFFYDFVTASAQVHSFFYRTEYFERKIAGVGVSAARFDLYISFRPSQQQLCILTVGLQQRVRTKQ